MEHPQPNLQTIEKSGSAPRRAEASDNVTGADRRRMLSTPFRGLRSLPHPTSEPYEEVKSPSSYDFRGAERTSRDLKALKSRGIPKRNSRALMNATRSREPTEDDLRALPNRTKNNQQSRRRFIQHAALGVGLLLAPNIAKALIKPSQTIESPKGIAIPQPQPELNQTIRNFIPSLLEHLNNPNLSDPNLKQIKERILEKIDKEVNPSGLFGRKIDRSEDDSRTKAWEKDVVAVINNPKYNQIFSGIKDKELFVKQALAVIWVESKGRPDAKNGPGIGLFQIEKAVIDDFEKDHKYRPDPNVVEDNILLGTYYLNKLLGPQFADGDFIKAAAMYNLGPGTILEGERIFVKQPENMKKGYDGKQNFPSYEALTSDERVKNLLGLRFPHTRDFKKYDFIYRYPAALIRMFNKSEFEEYKKAA